VSEQVESTHEAFESGATLVHLHVRHDDESPTSNADRLAAVLDGIKRHCPGIITQVSTGGRSGAGREGAAMLALKPDMASLATGSVNFPTRVYDNAPDLVEWVAAEMQKHSVKPEVEAFDLSMIFQAVKMQREGRITATGAGIGRDQVKLARWSPELGGICRTGLEDDVRLSKDNLAPSNAALVRQVVQLCCARSTDDAANVEEARALLGLPGWCGLLLGGSSLRVWTFVGHACPPLRCCRKPREWLLCSGKVRTASV